MILSEFWAKKEQQEVCEHKVYGRRHAFRALSKGVLLFVSLPVLNGQKD